MDGKRLIIMKKDLVKLSPLKLRALMLLNVLHGKGSPDAPLM
jgi:hypothetical protein